MEEIKLPNRDGADLKLVSEDGVSWKPVVDEHHKYIFEYLRVIHNDDGSLYMIDFSGGPCITVGSYINYYQEPLIVTAIEWADKGFVIHTKEYKS